MATLSETHAPSDAEKIKFADDTLAQLDDPDQAQKFVDNIKNLGRWANRLDADFDRITLIFAEMVERHGPSLPDLSRFQDEWKGYRARWIRNLATSRDVALQHASVLHRWDMVFLEMIESIQTDQDRKDVIHELGEFINSDQGSTDRMSGEFCKLKGDVTDFVARLGKFIDGQGMQSEESTKNLCVEIDALTSEIADLQEKIKAATMALAGSVAFFLLGLVVPGGTLAALQALLAAKELELQQKRSKLEDKKHCYADLPLLKLELTIASAELAILFDKISVFGDIWSSVRQQTINFREHLKQGMEAIKNLRFKKEVRLAREMCAPVRAGLEQYAAELESNPNIKSDA